MVKNMRYNKNRPNDVGAIYNGKKNKMGKGQLSYEVHENELR
jgi:hypothetical protein